MYREPGHGHRNDGNRGLLDAPTAQGTASQGAEAQDELSEELRSALDLYLDLPADCDEEAFAVLVKKANASMDRSIANLDDAIATCKKTVERISELERR